MTVPVRVDEAVRPTGPENSAGPSNFDIFVLSLTFLSLANIILMLFLRDQDVVNVVLIVDGVVCLIFMADFLHRMYRAPDNQRYFFHEGGWLDLVGSLPFPAFRVARLYRVNQVARDAGRIGPRRLLRRAVADRASASLVVIAFLIILVLQYGSMAILRVEDHAGGSNIHTASDAMWWSFVSITTVGYGDRFPVTDTGRIIGIVLITLGVGLFGVLTAYLANVFISPGVLQRDPLGMRNISNDEIQKQLDELRDIVAVLRVQVRPVDPSGINETTEQFQVDHDDGRD